MGNYNVKVRLNNGRTIEFYNVTYIDREDDGMVTIRYLLAKYGDKATAYIPTRNLEIIYVNPIVDHSNEEETESTVEVVPTQKMPPKEVEA